MSTETPGPDITSRPSGRAARERTHDSPLPCAAASILVTVCIVVCSARDAVTFVTLVPGRLLHRNGVAHQPERRWVAPAVERHTAGDGISAVIALPTGVAAAIYLSEYASARCARFEAGAGN